MPQLTIDTEQLEQLIVQKLPTLMQQSSEVQKVVLELARQNFADRQETDDKFYQLLGELRRDREEQARKWKEYTEEQNRKWDEQNQKWDDQKQNWDEQNRKWKEHRCEFDRVHEEIMALAKKYDRTVGALGARWGMQSERTFRKALASILEENFDVEVLNVNEYDDEGMVFGRPDQVELDVIIKNGLLIICELKSSMSRSDVYIFERKVRFYEKRHQCQANRRLIISPMVEKKAQKIANELGIEVFHDSLDVECL
jgi:hypothetical protein